MSNKRNEPENFDLKTPQTSAENQGGENLGGDNSRAKEVQSLGDVFKALGLTQEKQDRAKRKPGVHVSDLPGKYQAFFDVVLKKKSARTLAVVSMVDAYMKASGCELLPDGSVKVLNQTALELGASEGNV